MVRGVSRLASILAVLVTACAHPASATTPADAATPALCNARVARMWHGRTSNARADEYAAYLGEGIKAFARIPGNLGYQMMRETIGDETHFSVISYWPSRDAIRAYAGDDISKVHDLPRDPEFLIDREPQVKNYDLAVLSAGCPAGVGSPKS
jgi:heme-degrading monooxygenase HmoA